MWDLVTGAGTGVPHPKGDARVTGRSDGRGPDTQLAIGEVRVAQTVSEGKRRVSCQVDVVVATTCRLVIVTEGELALRNRKRDRQASGRIHISQ